jgi:hypothetical protein
MPFRAIIPGAALAVILASTPGQAAERDLGFTSDTNGAVAVGGPPMNSNEVGVLDEADGGGVEVQSGSDRGLAVAVAPESSIMATLLGFAGFSR